MEDAFPSIISGVGLAIGIVLCLRKDIHGGQTLIAWMVLLLLRCTADRASRGFPTKLES